MKLLRPSLGGVQSLRSENPSVAMREGQQIQRGMESIASVGRSATRYFNALDIDEASTDMSLAYSDFINKVQEVGETMTAEQAREFGYDGPNLLGEDMEDREDVELWEVLPDIAKKKYDELTEKFASRIPGQANRQEWTNARKEQSQRMYTDMLQQQQDAYFERKVQKKERAIEQAKIIGDWQLARSLAASHPDPSVRQEQIDEVNYAKEVASIHEAYNSGDLEAMQEEISRLTSDEYEGRLTTVERTSNANMLRAEQGRIQNSNRVKRFTEYEDLRKSYEVLKALEDPRAFDALNSMEQMLVNNGMQEYAPKGFFATELGQLTKIFVDLENLSHVDSAWAAGDYSAIDTTNNDHVNRINKLVDQTIQAARESGDATTIFQAHAVNIDRAISTGVLPNHYKEAIRDLAQPNISQAHIREYGTIYNQLATSGHPNILSDMSERDRLIAKEVFLASRAGADMEETLRDIHGRYRTMTEDAITEREKQFKNLADSQGNDILGKQLRSRSESFLQKVPIVGSMLSPFMKEAFSEISYQDQQDYNQLVRHYMLNGADEEVAFDAAFDTWAVNHTVSAVNGRGQRMRMAPEYIYGLETEDLRVDFEDYVKSAIDPADRKSSGNYQMYPDMVTLGQQKPSYVVFHENENGILDMVVDDEGNVLRYQPDKDRINNRALKANTDRARNLRELGYDPVALEKLVDESNIRPLPTEMLQGGLDQTNWDENMARSRAAKKERQRQSRIRVIDERSDQIAEDRRLIQSLESQ